MNEHKESLNIIRETLVSVKNVKSVKISWVLLNDAVRPEITVKLRKHKLS